MVERANKFPHIQLSLVRTGSAELFRGGARQQNPRTTENFGNRQGHGSRLKNSIESIIFYWQDTQEKREEEAKPPLPNSKPLILKIDPSAFDPASLKSYGIELIAELEDGYIIGASGDIKLSELQKKIEKFINGEQRSGKVGEIWELLEGDKLPEYILSPDLLSEWDKINGQQIYTVDVGIACIGIKSKLPDYPKETDSDTKETYSKKIINWINKRDITYQEWDDLKSQREDELTKFVSLYQGEILNIVDGIVPSSAELSDSFSCRVQISGNGLKDLVSNFPYVFDVSEPDKIVEHLQPISLHNNTSPPFQLEPPEPDAPKVCVMDSGIQEGHSLLKAAIDSQNSKSWIPGEIDKTADYVNNGGHGTRVAGAVLYPRNIPRSGREKAVCWIQNARVLDKDCKLPDKLFPPSLLGDIVDFYNNRTNTRIFNHSITGAVPCGTQYMSAWAATIDNLTWQRDILFIVAAGNLPINNKVGATRLSISEHLAANRPYPDYLFEKSCRIANPAQSFQALTVGSISSASYHVPPYSSIAEQDKPSAFSCAGLGLWGTIKPEVVEYGGDLVKDESIPPNLTYPTNVCPELVRSTLSGGSAFDSDNIGTSFAAPKVSYIAACLAAELPKESCLLYRALIVQSARWSAWATEQNADKLQVIRQMGYGLANLERALSNSSHRITLMTTGEPSLKAGQAHVYQVKLPEQLRSQGEAFDILVEVTLSYKAQPRRTRRNRRKYLSTWLDWDCSKKGEDSKRFLARILQEYDAPEDAEKGEGLFKWTLGKQNNHGTVRGVSRSAGTIQKDWATLKSFELTEAFCIAVVGHEGWNNDPDAQVPYSLVVSFEAVENNIPIYAALIEAQVEIEVEQQIESY